MLIKEYRIPLPLTVDEYRIAQLYMIAKKSRDESSGAGSGIEILTNEPYTDGPGGQGQYTKKIYHVGSHLPGWFKSILPKSALSAEEEAWNAYPFTKTRYGCPFVEKFSVEIETYYFPDNGYQNNVFNLSDSELRNRTVDVIDIVKDQLYGADYLKEEDPKLYSSSKTGRGPLSEEWLADYWAEVEGKSMPTDTGKSLMCAYKLCRVEFRYWGMQTKLEKFIHDTALRKVMVRAHKQAWTWQDEWHGLTMEDIREIERQTQEALKAKMDPDASDESADDPNDSIMGSPTVTTTVTSPSDADGDCQNKLAKTLGSIEKQEDRSPESKEAEPADTGRRWSRTSGRGVAGAVSPSGSTQGLDMQIANWRIESIRRDSNSGSEEEFYDCQDDGTESSSLAKWSSLDLLAEEEPESTCVESQRDSIFSATFLQRVASERRSVPESPLAHPVCATSILCLVLHAGSVLDGNVDLAAKKSDVTTFKGAWDAVMRQHYPAMVGHIAIRLVPCPPVCTEALGVLSSLSPYSFDVSPSAVDSSSHVTHDSIPIGAIPLFATSSAEYEDSVSRAINACNSVYQEFVRSPEGKGFTGQVIFVGDSMGSILAYDALCRPSHYNSRHDSENSILDTEFDFQEVDKHLSAPQARRRSSSTSEQSHCKLDMEVSDLFTFGSPLAMVLAYRKVLADDKAATVPKPGSVQVYNMFHPTDPVAARLEPLLSARFSLLPPVNVARYQKYPLGDGQPYHLLEIIQSNSELFMDNASNAPGGSGLHLRRMSELSMLSTISGMAESLPIHAINNITQRWWGNKRLDYALYCPDGLTNFPTNALPHLFHASYWESSDVIAFILRQAGRFETPHSSQPDKESSFSPNQPREKWIKKRTSVKLKNMAANHRANDVIVREGMPQKIVARFMYGPLDVIALTGEKVDIHVMKDSPAGEWTHLSTELTDKCGRVSYTIANDRALGYGMYPIKMIVRGDHTSVDLYLAVIPSRTECVVFSIDGSFTASMSVTGRDPKVRAGAVDVVRHWQELGYLIIYITGRPDMQQHKVVSWLSQHNFPHGLISFADGLSTDPLGHKADYLRTLMAEHRVVIHAAYGSSKDISVYTAIGLTERQIYIIGKVSEESDFLPPTRDCSRTLAPTTTTLSTC